MEPQAVFAAVVNLDAQQPMHEEVEKRMQEQALQGAPVCQIMDQVAEHEYGAEHEYVDPIDYATGAMIYGSDYKTSYFVEALKYYKDGGTYVIQSTSFSNNATHRHPSFSYHYMEVWCAETPAGM